MIYLKVHNDQKGKIVAACDVELIGQILQDKKTYLDLNRYSGFYVGEKVTEEELEKNLDEFTSINLVGKHAVGVALKKKLVSKKDVMYINDIPYIQIYRI
jgi:hypothetical protein